MLKEMTQSKQVAARQLQTEPGLTLGNQNNGGHIYFVFRLLLLMLSDSTQLMYNISVSIQYEKENHFCERMQADRHSEYEASVYKWSWLGQRCERLNWIQYEGPRPVTGLRLNISMVSHAAPGAHCLIESKTFQNLLLVNFHIRFRRHPKRN